MREMLFRGKAFNGEWEYGVPVFSGLNNELAFMKQMHSYDHQVIPETVGQYTGLTDKNGKKIFEDDILKNIESNGIVAICYSGCSYCYSHNGTIYGIDDSETGLKTNEWEVIGNIHDNPELLEAEK